MIPAQVEGAVADGGGRPCQGFIAVGFPILPVTFLGLVWFQHLRPSCWHELGVLSNGVSMTSAGQLELSLMFVHSWRWIPIWFFVFQHFFSLSVNFIGQFIISKTKITMAHRSKNFLTHFRLTQPPILSSNLIFPLIGINNMFGCFKEIFINFRLRIWCYIFIFGHNPTSFISGWFLLLNRIFIDVLVCRSYSDLLDFYNIFR